MENIGEVYLNAHVNYSENLTAKTNRTVDVIKGYHQTKKIYVVAGGGSYKWLYRNQVGKAKPRTCNENRSQVHNT